MEITKQIHQEDGRMELAAEAKVDNQVITAYQWTKLQKNWPSSPLSHSRPLFRISPDYNPDLDIVILDNERSWPNGIFRISPTLEHRPPEVYRG